MIQKIQKNVMAELFIEQNILNTNSIVERRVNRSHQKSLKR